MKKLRNVIAIVGLMLVNVFASCEAPVKRIEPGSTPKETILAKIDNIERWGTVWSAQYEADKYSEEIRRTLRVVKAVEYVYDDKKVFAVFIDYTIDGNIRREVVDFAKIDGKYFYTYGYINSTKYPDLSEDAEKWKSGNESLIEYI